MWFSYDFFKKVKLFFHSSKLAKQSTDVISFLHPGSISPGKVYKLYPHMSNRVLIVFIYGDDFKRQMAIWNVPGAIRLIALLIIIFMSLATVILLIIRKIFKLRRNDLFSTVIDILIVFIGGGSLVMRHKWERWFFGILLFAAFFITSMFAGDLLDCMIQVQNRKFEKIDELAGFSTPIYLNSFWRNEYTLIKRILE